MDTQLKILKTCFQLRIPDNSAFSGATIHARLIVQVPGAAFCPEQSLARLLSSIIRSHPSSRAQEHVWKGVSLQRIDLSLRGFQGPGLTLSDLGNELLFFLENSCHNSDFFFLLEGLTNSTDFRIRVWKACMDIKPGDAITYGALARMVGSGSPRAVGQALRANPLPLIVPCHRIVRAQGRLGGYCGRYSRRPGHWSDAELIKALLLAHEGNTGFLASLQDQIKIQGQKGIMDNKKTDNLRRSHGDRPYLLGIDTGGTFTDFACLMPDGSWRRWKVLSTPEDPALAILQGLQEILGTFDPARVKLVHGTTVGTNAFLERKGARTCMITTRGFEDVIFIGRQARPKLYDLYVEKPPGLISKDHILGISERILHTGEVLQEMDDNEIENAMEFCRSSNAESVAVCLIHSYANPQHERRLRDALRAAGFRVSVSCDILPEFREFERFSTTVINAYLAPVVGGYISRLAEKLPGMTIFIQQSNGGALPAEAAEERAVSTLLSGPAGGVVAAWNLAQELGMDRIITVDMGGTSTDVSLCCNGLTYTRDYQIQGFPVALPMIDIHTVGAGGGSIAWIDRGGLLKVGPESAGADPGPVCYGRGDRITVTDANLFLGRLVPEGFLGGRMGLDEHRVSPFMEELGARLGLDALETASGIIRLVNINMVQAIRAVSLEKGYDPREFVLFSFGGAAGLHALELAEELEMERVIMPAMAGVFSAQGMAGSSLMFDSSRSVFIQEVQAGSAPEREAAIVYGRLQEVVRELRERQLEKLAALGISAWQCRFQPRIDCRYEGQSFEITVPLTENWKELFFQEHLKRYGYVYQDRPVQVTAARLMILVQQEQDMAGNSPGDAVVPASPLSSFSKGSHCTPETHRKVYLSGREQTVPVYRRIRLGEGILIEGPALILDEFTTILVPDSWSVQPIPGGHLQCSRCA